MPVYIDQLNREVNLTNSPKRIVSLVPSQTELLYHLGLANNIVGVTRFCVHPANARTEKTVIGGTKAFNFEIIDSLKPDLIIGNKEENYAEGIAQLEKKYPVWVSDIYTLNHALKMIAGVGNLTGKCFEALALINEIKQAFRQINKRQASVAYLIWHKPQMAAGSNTFVNNMLQFCGLTNVFNGRYPETSIKQLQEIKPNYVFLSSEPYPFKAKNLEEFQQQLPYSKVVLVDGEYFSWYGSRLKNAAAYFNKLLLAL